MKRLIAFALITAISLSLFVGCTGDGVSTGAGETVPSGSVQDTRPSETVPAGSHEPEQGGNTQPTTPDNEPIVPTDPTDDNTHPGPSGDGETTESSNPDDGESKEPPVSGGDDSTKPTTPGGDNNTQPTTPGGSGNAESTTPGGSGSTEPTNPEEDDKEVVLPGEGIPIDTPKELPESYLYPSSSVTKFNKNDSGIYKNDYVKLDATHATDGYLLITYNDPYATEFVVYLEESNALSDEYEGMHEFDYKKGAYTMGKEISIKLPTAEAKYYISIRSTINGKKSVKLKLNLGLIVRDGTVSLDHILPSEDQIQLTQTSNGVYENEYVRININTANKGYIQVESLDSAAENLKVSLYTDVKNQMTGYGNWQYNCKQKGKSTVKAALTYGNGTYEIDVWTTLSSEAVGITRSTRKAKLTVTLNNVSKTGGFTLSTGEVAFSTGMHFIKKADEIAATCSNDFEKVSKIYAWLTDYLDYKASDDYTALGLYTCDLDKVYNRGYGVCYDYAVILAAMLRSQGIPCKVVFGKYADSDGGHAWNEIYICSNGSITTDRVDIVGNKWCRLDPTLSHINSGKQSTDYMNTDSNYVWHSIY